MYGQVNDTAQVVDEARVTSGFGPRFPSTRRGAVDYEQVGYGASAQGRQWLGDLDDGMLLTFGASYKTDYFDMQRDRTETNTVTGEPVPSEFIFPSKYFPESDLAEVGVYLQGEIRFGRITLVPGVRYDHYAPRRQSGRPHLRRGPQPRGGRLLRRRPVAEGRPGGAG